MIDKKYQVPGGMLKAAIEACPSTPSFAVEAALLAGSRWLSGHLNEMYDKYNQPFGSTSEAAVNRYSTIRNAQLQVIEEIRHIFLAPELEVLDTLADLIPIQGVTADGSREHAEKVIEAFKRGKKDGYEEGYSDRSREVK